MALLCVIFFLCFVIFPYGVPGQVWYFIASISDLRFLPYLNSLSFSFNFTTCNIQNSFACAVVFK